MIRLNLHDAALLTNSWIYMNLNMDYAVCLDGSLPGYHLHQGYGSGANSWLIQLEVCHYPSTEQ